MVGHGRPHIIVAGHGRQHIIDFCKNHIDFKIRPNPYGLCFRHFYHLPTNEWGINIDPKVVFHFCFDSEVGKMFDVKFNHA